MARWRPLIVLSVMQFLMVLDTSVMNVSISQLVADFDTTVSSIQAVITLYSLVMAALMIAGGKVGDIVGRRRVLVIGLMLFAAGSALTTVSWSVASLALGWSVLEGIGAALVLPAMAALIAGNYRGGDRVTAYGVMGGTAGAAIALGPIVGGWITTQYSWRAVFGAEVVVALGVILASRVVVDSPRPTARPKLDIVGALLTAVGLTAIVGGLLMSSTWGWLTPVNSPIQPFGYALTPFVVCVGLAILYVFVLWEARRERLGLDPLVRLRLFRIHPLKSGLTTLLSMNVVFMGVFFILPLYLQIFLGLNAFETGLRLLPMSLVMFVVSFCGGPLLYVLSPRSIIRISLFVMVLATLLLLVTVEPTFRERDFVLSMALMGAGMGLMASQLGNVILSSVGPESRSEAGGLQYTAQQLGGALGVALIGSIVMTGLASTYINQLGRNSDIPPATTQSVEVDLSNGVKFVPGTQAATAVAAAGFTGAVADQLVATYEEAQLQSLKSGLLAAAGVAALSFLVTGGLPTRRLDDLAAEQGDDGRGPDLDRAQPPAEAGEGIDSDLGNPISDLNRGTR